MRAFLSCLPAVLADTCSPLAPQYGDVYEYDPVSQERSFSSVVDREDATWSPKIMDEHQWMEIAIPQGAELVGVRTQGRAAAEWVSTYGLLLKEAFADNQFWYFDAGDGAGNVDGHSIVDRNLTLPEHGLAFSALRIAPHDWQKAISMKVSLLLRDRLTSGNPYPTKVPAGDAATVYSGIGRFVGQMTCTAFYIDTPGSDAYALSAGHCTQDFFSASGVMRVVAEDKSWPINFRLNSGSTVQVSTTRVEYATMQGMDVSLVRLNRTKQEMSDLGVRALQLAESLPELGAAVSVLGVPSGDDTLQRASCQHLGLADIAERFASWEAVVKNDCAGIREGFSGSPMLDAAGRVYAVLGTTTIGAISETCAMGNPCEVVAARSTGARTCNETNYGARAIAFHGCFDERGFNSSLSTCALKQKIGTERLIPSRIVNTPANDHFGNPDLLWQVEVPSGWEAVKYKQGPAHGTHCQEEAGWSEAIGIGDDQPLKSIAIDDREGLYRFCIVGKKSGGAFQPFAQSTYFVTYVDNTPPTRIPSVVAGNFGTDFVEPIFDVPELVDFRYALPEGEADTCPSNTTSYRRYMRFPFQVDLVNKHQAPLCLQGSDYAGQWGPVYRFLAVNSSMMATTTSLTVMV